MGGKEDGKVVTTLKQVLLKSSHTIFNFILVPFIEVMFTHNVNSMKNFYT